MSIHPLDTPTPPSQSYSQLLQTSLRPMKSPASQRKSRLSQQVRMVDGMDQLSVTTSDSAGFTAQPRLDGRRVNKVNNHEHDENEDPLQHSLGYGDAGMGMGFGVENKNRFLDLHNFGWKQKNNGPTAKRTRVDEQSDATIESSSSDAEHSMTSEDDEFSARLGLNNHNNNKTNNMYHSNNPRRNTSTPFHNANSNVSKSAFDGMARELRKEFERIMDSGKAARTYSSDQNMPPPPMPLSSVSPAHRRYSANNINTPSTLMPRGVVPKRVSPISYKSGNPPSDRKDTTPKAIRTFGQELPSYHQPLHQTNGHAPSPQYIPSASPKYALSPFQVSSVAPIATGVIAPNNTRATNSSPAVVRQPYSSSYHSPARSISSYAALRVPDITGLTEGLTSPSRATSGPSSHLCLPSNGSPKSRSRSPPPSSKSAEGIVVPSLFPRPVVILNMIMAFSNRSSIIIRTRGSTKTSRLARE